MVSGWHILLGTWEQTLSRTRKGRVYAVKMRKTLFYYFLQKTGWDEGCGEATSTCFHRF